MKTRFLYILFSITTFIWSACEKHNYAEGILSPFISLEDVRNIYKGTDITLNEQNLIGARQVVGVVTSDVDSGNVPAGIVILQNNNRQRIRGISLNLGASASSYHPGDSLVISIRGAVLKKVDGSMQLTEIADTAITKISTKNPFTIRNVSSYTINLNPREYEGTMVSIKSASVSPSPLPGEPYAGDRYLVNGNDSVAMHTESSAHFAQSFLPGGATVAGILFVNQDAADNTKASVWPRYLSDITDIREAIDPNAPVLGKNAVVITGYTTDVLGADGNYEYFQFKATENIDFSKTPMSVVTCTNAGSASPYPGAAPGGGWATGGGRTYKFDLTEGTVLKGEFFYAGGSNKKINGANSTDLSTAKWIRSIAYVTTDGDGYGSKSSGLLPNSGNAGGIAIFGGTNITVKSIPMDAVFYGGTGTTTIVDVVNGIGYRIPDNDHYHAVDPETAVEQPFFYQGNNLYRIPYLSPTVQGIFIKLGGTFNTKTDTWETARAYTFYVMTTTAALSEIETDQVTQLSGN
ncbi:DUF5689 domain-containing protein [Arcticibacter eurypsychrophilus]|uniref:DUF5689 domain-containing protein n=1 Tax=Arcticibacter eurypsychrophilus TaxID=1434752 RepID=UPI0009F1FD49|nr:DUF5689 domain-containing protein [Arcticibacter eurypsychrophilus]